MNEIGRPQLVVHSRLRRGGALAFQRQQTIAGRMVFDIGECVGADFGASQSGAWVAARIIMTAKNAGLN